MGSDIMADAPHNLAATLARMRAAEEPRYYIKWKIPSLQDIYGTSTWKMLSKSEFAHKWAIDVDRKMMKQLANYSTEPIPYEALRPKPGLTLAGKPR